MLTQSQLAEILEVHPQTIKTWRMQGKIPAVKDEGRYVFSATKVMKALLKAKPAEKALIHGEKKAEFKARLWRENRWHDYLVDRNELEMSGMWGGDAARMLRKDKYRPKGTKAEDWDK